MFPFYCALFGELEVMSGVNRDGYEDAFVVVSGTEVCGAAWRLVVAEPRKGSLHRVRLPSLSSGCSLNPCDRRILSADTHGDSSILRQIRGQNLAHAMARPQCKPTSGCRALN